MFCHISFGSLCFCILTHSRAINYGAIGAVIGHEITHGFDDQGTYYNLSCLVMGFIHHNAALFILFITGSQFDKDGNLKNWWNPESMSGFESRKECIIDQYSAYRVPDTDFNVRKDLNPIKH
jgi:predicted metalloendopeptidase